MPASAVPPWDAARDLAEAAVELAGATSVDALLRTLCRRAVELVAADAAAVVVDSPVAGGHPVVADGLREATVQSLERTHRDGGDLLLGADDPEVRVLGAASGIAVDHVSAALRADGVRSVAMLPVRTEEERTASILVARRRPPELGERELAALGLLVRVAAPLHLAVQSAEAQRARETELAEAARAALADRDAARELVAMEQELVTAVLPTIRQDAFAERLSRTLGFEVWLIDAGVPLWDQPLPARLRDVVTQRLRERGRGASVTAGSATWLGIVVQDELLGGIVTTAPLDDRGHERLRHARAAASAYLAWLRSLRELQFREQVELIDELLSARGADDSALVSSRLAEHGLAEPAFSVAVAAVGISERAEAVAVLGRALRPCVVAVHDGDVCLIAAAVPALTLAERVRDVLGDRGVAAAVGCDGPVGSPTEIAGAYDVARSVASTLVASGRPTAAGDRFTVGALGLLISHGGREGSRILVRRMIGVVLDHDADRGTALARTALAFLDANQSVRRTASLLHVHENTVRLRLERLDALLSAYWRVGPRALDHHVAFRLWATLDHLST